LAAVTLAVGIAGMILTDYHDTSADLLISRVLQATHVRGIAFRPFGTTFAFFAWRVATGATSKRV
jgi:hypothetical protein